MDIGTIVDHAQGSRGHYYPNPFIGGNSTAVLGDVHIHGPAGADNEEREEKERRALLAALAYNGMAARRRQLAEQSPVYLEWIWRQPFDGGSRFVEWLRNEAPVFWVTGKPGSGKSTLMKYLAEHESGPRILQHHHNCSWFLVHFYFDYRSGKEMPNSLEGLLRSILYQFVGANSTANQAVREHLNARHGYAIYENLDKSDLQRAFRIACKAVARTHKICAFVDGLDEFSGHHIEVVGMVHFLTNNGVHKLCVASRPEYVLAQHLARHPHLKMQDCNLQTIRAYVSQTLEKLPLHLPDMDVGQLIAKIVSRAEGVILWAHLVTGHLAELLLSGGTREEVYKRLDEFPKELNEVYERLLNNVKFDWQVEAAVLLLLIQTGLETTNPWDLNCAMSYLRDCRKLPSWPKNLLTPYHFVLRLRARTGSMVDIIHGPSLFPDSTWQEAPSGDDFRDRFHCQSTRVRLFHKTLDNYLTTSNWLNQVLTQANPAIDPEHLWLRLCSKCIVENEVSEQEHKQVLNLLSRPNIRTENPSKVHDPTPTSSKSAIRLAKAISGSVPIDWVLAFLACALADLPAHLELVSPRVDALKVEYVENALASRLMQLHPIRARLRTYEAPLSACKCIMAYPEWDLTFDGHNFDSAQRANLVAMAHEWLELFSLNTVHDPPAANGTEAIFYERCIKWLLIPRINADEKHLLLVLARLAGYVDDTVLVDIILAPTGFSNRALAVLCPGLRTRGSSRILHNLVAHPRYPLALQGMSNSASNRIMNVASITSYGYNLLLPWVWCRFEKYHLNAGGLMDEMLTILLRSGLDVNAPCSIFGPPAHTLVETVVAYHNVYVKQFEDILRCLIRHGADMDVHGPHGTVLDTARWTLRKQELGQYEMFSYSTYQGRKQWYLEATLGIIEMLQHL
ncbi:hypothetical protein LTR70_009031 [Exophiala xenobiotica]|uniref:Nephrocystin 3-like N-terminal domain-containing protein n=1 Tax=Lithohypha guttulata TaxID=1690604 RepID=A0ABR0JZ61_9EURO|nr:hypothetical protein LTR24_008728 [Lithohypha guttulata]KAK5311081.1 hypothetical protein LTR70_009031 [Exophiala xenobiotica]